MDLMEMVNETHLTFIQNIISRMANNSFLIKGWSVTIVAALFVISAKDSNRSFILLAYLPVLLFWFLDAFFLQSERKYRELYKQVAAEKIKSNDFTLDISKLNGGNLKYFHSLFSITLLLFHGGLLAIILLVIFISCS